MTRVLEFLSNLDYKTIFSVKEAQQEFESDEKIVAVLQQLCSSGKIVRISIAPPTYSIKSKIQSIKLKEINSHFKGLLEDHKTNQVSSQ